MMCIQDENEFDEEYFYSDSELMNKFLEVFYQDTDFVKLTADEQTQKELDELLIGDNKIAYETPETEIDKEIVFALESDLKIMINVADSYYTNENGILEKVYFSSDEYTKSFLSDEENAEILYHIMPAEIIQAHLLLLLRKCQR